MRFVPSLKSFRVPTKIRTFGIAPSGAMKDQCYLGDSKDTASTEGISEFGNSKTAPVR